MVLTRLRRTTSIACKRLACDARADCGGGEDTKPARHLDTHRTEVVHIDSPERTRPRNGGGGRCGERHSLLPLLLPLRINRVPHANCRTQSIRSNSSESGCSRRRRRVRCKPCQCRLQQRRRRSRCQRCASRNVVCERPRSQLRWHKRWLCVVISRKASCGVARARAWCMLLWRAL